MPIRFARREFLAGMVAVTAANAAARFMPPESHSPFRVSVINDEISQDFDRACSVAAREFGMGWMELRSMWKKNICSLDEKEVAEARRILEKYQLKVTDIASPLFKVDFPGAPKSKFSEAKSFGADFSIGSSRTRCWTVPSRWRRRFRPIGCAASTSGGLRIRLRIALPSMTNCARPPAKAEKMGIILVLENESACNTATGAEAAKVLSAVQTPSFMLNWDPGNAAAAGETPFPDGYNLLPKDRIGHCHCKDTVKKGKKYDWAPMGGGLIDWAGQFKALKRDGYHFAVSLETHWGGGGSPEESSRKSWAGMKKLLQHAGAS